MIQAKRTHTDIVEIKISFSENFADMTLRDRKFFRKGFESSFHLLSQYIEDGVDLETARDNVRKILEAESCQRINAIKQPTVKKSR